eukprot:2112645-Pyramimonas_sp.AAC.1
MRKARRVARAAAMSELSTSLQDTIEGRDTRHERFVMRQQPRASGGQTKHADPNLPIKLDESVDLFPDDASEDRGFLGQFAASECGVVGYCSG